MDAALPKEFGAPFADGQSFRQESLFSERYGFKSGISVQVVVMLITNQVRQIIAASSYAGIGLVKWQLCSQNSVAQLRKSDAHVLSYLSHFQQRECGRSPKLIHFSAVTILCNRAQI